jgi:hypothetical protein
LLNYSLRLHLASGIIEQESYIELAAKLLRRKRMAQERWRRTVTRLPTETSIVANSTAAAGDSSTNTTSATTGSEQPLRPTVSPFCDDESDSPHADMALDEEHVITDAVEECTAAGSITASSDSCDDVIEQQQQQQQNAASDPATVNSAVSSSGSSKTKALNSSVRRVHDANPTKGRPRKQQQQQQRKAARALHSTAAAAAVATPKEPSSGNSMVLLPQTSPITVSAAHQQQQTAFPLGTVAEHLCSSSSSSSGIVQAGAGSDVAADVDRHVSSSYGGLLDGALSFTVHSESVDLEQVPDAEIEVDATGITTTTTATAAAAAATGVIADEIDSNSDSEPDSNGSSCSSAAVSEQCASKTAANDENDLEDDVADDVADDVCDDHSVMSSLTTVTRQGATVTAESDLPEQASTAVQRSPTAVQRSLGTALPFAPLFGGYWDDFEEHERQTVAQIVISSLDNGCPTDDYSTAAATTASSTAYHGSSCSLAGFSSSRGAAGAVGDDSSLADGGIGHHELKLHLKELGARQDFFKLYRIIARQREVRVRNAFDA